MTKLLVVFSSPCLELTSELELAVDRHIHDDRFGVHHAVVCPVNLPCSLFRPCNQTMAWEKWAAAATSVPWWKPGRCLRVATDCSGMGIPELALWELARTVGGRSVDSVFACDIGKPSQRWFCCSKG